MRYSKTKARLLLAFVSALIALGACFIAARLIFPAFMRSTDELLKLASRTQPAAWNGRSCRGDIKQPIGFITRKSDEPDIIYELKPNIDTCFQGARVRTNSQGFRAEADFSLEKPKGTIRILGLGDSFMFGWGAEGQETYAEKIEHNLSNELRSPAQFINTAVPGYNTAIEAAVLEKRGIAYQPDVVVLHWCWNDFELPPFLQGAVYESMTGEEAVARALDKICALLKPKGIPLIVIGNSLGDSRQRQFLKTVLDTHAIAYIETDESPDWWLAPNDRHLSLLGHSRYAQLLAEAIKTAVTRP